MKIRMKQLSPVALKPTTMPGDGGIDMRLPYSLRVLAGATTTVPLGWAFEMPEGWHLLALQKSRHAGVILVQAPLVDNSYRGQVHASVHNLTNHDLDFQQGDPILQLMPVYSPDMDLEQVEELSDTQRGDGAFGSTG